MYSYGNYGYDYSGTVSRMFDGMLAVVIISAVIALGLAIYFLSRKRYESSRWKPGLHGLFRFVNFDMYIFSVVQKYLYLFLTVLTVIASFVIMFQDDGFVTGLMVLIIGPIAVRLIYELMYIIFAMRDLLASANRTLLDIKQDGAGSGNAHPFRRDAATESPAAPRPAPQPAPAARRFCPKCGKELKNGASFCSNCGTRM